MDIATVSMEYWFAGPEGGVPMSAAYSPDDFFEAHCEVATNGERRRPPAALRLPLCRCSRLPACLTRVVRASPSPSPWGGTGCDKVKLEVLPGYEALAGARYYVNISFDPGAGVLLPTGDNAVPQIFLGNGTEQQIVVITIRAKVSGVYLNSTQVGTVGRAGWLRQLMSALYGKQCLGDQSLRRASACQIRPLLQDYSFLNTPALPPGPNATVVPRQAQPNERIPAYIGGTLVWGRLPIASQSALPAAPPAAEANAGDGVTCEAAQGGGQQTCGLSAVYCCRGPEPVDPFIPEVWPPTALGLAPSAERPMPPGLEVVPGSAGSTPSSTPPSSTPVSASSAPPPASGGGGSSSVGLIAGVAVGAAAAAVGLLAGVLLVRRRRQRRKRQQQFMAGDKDYVAPNGDLANGGGPGPSSFFPAGAGFRRQSSSAANGNRVRLH